MLAYLKSIGQWPLGFKLLYMLIIFDGAATYCGLNLGVITEANPLMAVAFHFNPLLTLIFKLVLSLFFLSYIYYAARIKKVGWPLKVIPVLIVIHSAVAVMHFCWIRFVF